MSRRAPVEEVSRRAPAEGAIRRAPAEAAREAWDLVVVGGGIYGVALALEAARRGLRALLLERDDFGGATSWNSFRIVHGGLRYLQSLDLRRFRDSVAERRWFLARFPDLVRPTAFVLPLYGEGLRRRGVLRLALAANDALSADRNRGVEAGRRIPAGRLLSAEETLARFPPARRDGLQGAALWHDAVMDDAPRVLMEMIRWACHAGATCLNYVEATELSLANGEVRGLMALDRTTGEEHAYRAPTVVNAAGPWSRSVASRLAGVDAPALFRPSIAFNLLLDREPPSGDGVAVAPRGGGPTYYMRPFAGRLLAGTYHASREGDVGPPGAAPELDAHAERFLGDLNACAPELRLRADEVLRVYAGYLPVAEEGSTRLATRPTILDHGRAGARGFFSVSGVKFTTARLVAERTLRRIHGRRLERPGVPRPPPAAWPRGTGLRALPGRDAESTRALLERWIREESVVRLDDLLLRRADWAQDPGELVELCDWLVGLLDRGESRADVAARVERATGLGGGRAGAGLTAGAAGPRRPGRG